MNANLLMTVVLMAGLAGCANSSKSGGHDEAGDPGEKKVTLDQVAAPAQRVIRDELVGGTLDDIAEESRAGETVYEADIVKGGQHWELVVAKDGRVISKRLEEEAEWRDSFDVDKSHLASSGDNSWMAIRPGKVLKFRHGADTLTVTVLQETTTVDGVQVGILEERETKAGSLIEVSRNFFATDPQSGDVYYFGEDVDNYKDGKIVSHESSWRAGERGARFGLFMPGKPRAGDRFYQEIAPKQAMDRVEVVSIDETVTTPAGTFLHCVHLKETTPLEPDVSHKWYAPGVGMIKDDEFELAEAP